MLNKPHSVKLLQPVSGVHRSFPTVLHFLCSDFIGINMITKKKEKTKYDVITESKLRIRKKSINSRDGIILTTKYIHIHNTHSILSD